MVPGWELVSFGWWGRGGGFGCRAATGERCVRVHVQYSMGGRIGLPLGSHARGKLALPTGAVGGNPRKRSAGRARGRGDFGCRVPQVRNVRVRMRLACWVGA